MAFAPDGKEVEELMGKEIWMQLRKKTFPNEFLRRVENNREQRTEDGENRKITEEEKEKLMEMSKNNEGTKGAILLNSSLEEIKKVSVRGLLSTLKKTKPYVVIIDGTATVPIISAAEDANSKVIVAKNFATTDTSMELMSF